MVFCCCCLISLDSKPNDATVNAKLSEYDFEAVKMSDKCAKKVSVKLFGDISKLPFANQSNGLNKLLLVLLAVIKFISFICQECGLKKILFASQILLSLVLLLMMLIV